MQTVAGQHLTGSGLPSMRRAVADHWDTKIPPDRRRQPVASNHSPNRLDLSIVTATSRVVSAAGQQKQAAQVLKLLLAQFLRRTGQGLWRLRGAQTREFPSPPRRCDPEERRAIHLAPGWPQELAEGRQRRRPAAFGSPLRIFPHG